MESRFMSTALRGSNKDPSSRKSNEVGHNDNHPNHDRRIPFDCVDEIDVKRAFAGDHEFAAYRRVRIADRSDEVERLRAAGGRKDLSSEHNDIIADGLPQSLLQTLRVLIHLLGEELDVLIAGDRRVQVHYALHAFDAGQSSPASGSGRKSGRRALASGVCCPEIGPPL